MITITEVWRDVLEQLRTLGATDIAYGDPARPDTELWDRAARIYNALARRGAVAAWWRLPEEPVPGVVAVLRRAYRTGGGQPLIPMDRLAGILRGLGHDSAYVEDTAGGCATLLVGPMWSDDNGEERYAAAAGPGAFYGPGLTQPYGHPDDFSINRDDDGATAGETVRPGMTLQDIAALIDRQVKKSIEITRQALADEQDSHD